MCSKNIPRTQAHACIYNKTQCGRKDINVVRKLLGRMVGKVRGSGMQKCPKLSIYMYEIIKENKIKDGI